MIEERNIDLEGLKNEMPFKFKPQSVKYGKALMVAYIDSRDVQDALDNYVGPENWQDSYSVLDGNICCGIGIKINDNWVWKHDIGTEANTEVEKSKVSDAYKRAAVKWGVGRFLYRQKIIELKSVTDKYGKDRPATDDGKILWTAEQFTNYIRKYKLGKIPAKTTAETPTPTNNENRYGSPPNSPTYTSPTWSIETIDKVKTLEKNGIKGKDCLILFLDKYNESKGTQYKLLAELRTDELLIGLINFVEAQPPEGI